jgi:SAM-dependent MidA family methyltransferase
VLDAMPCERIVYQNGEWHQQGVVIQNGSLALEIGPVVDRQLLPDYLLTHSFAEGYTTEINPQSEAWIDGCNSGDHEWSFYYAGLWISGERVFSPTA